MVDRLIAKEYTLFKDSLDFNEQKRAPTTPDVSERDKYLIQTV